MKDELVEELRQVQQLRSLIPLLSTLTIRQVLDAGGRAIDASGLNPWCINEGLADGSEQAISQWKIDAALGALDHIESLEAKLEKAREIAERLVDQRDEPVPNETQRLHYWRDKAIKSAQALKEISQ